MARVRATSEKYIFFSQTTLVCEKEKIKKYVYIKRMTRSAQKVISPVKLAIRLNDFGYLQKAREFFVPGDMFEAVYGIHHSGRKSDNKHWHFAVESWYSKDTIRARIAKEFDTQKGNKNHSVKEWDGSKTYIQYTLKELKDYNDIDTVLLVNARTGGYLMFGDLNTLHTRSQLIVEEIKENTPSKICMKIATQMIDGDFQYNDREIFRLICKYLIQKGSFLPNRFQAERWLLQVKGLQDCEASCRP
ncbi:putative CRESS viral-like replicase [Mamiellales associated circular virus 1]|nr:putative CRESS viral-like replicase [Mamiellales associated circular virus 1]